MSIPTMRAAVESVRQFPDKLPKSEMVKIVANDPEISMTRLYNARSVIKRKPELVDDILSGKLSLYLAYEIVIKGNRVRCPTCKGKGHIFK